MSLATGCCAPCETPDVVEVPGVQGDDGADGSDGADGISAFTLTTEAEDVASIGASVVFTVALNTAFAVGQTIFVSDGVDWGTFQITGKTGSTIITATKLDAGGDTATPFNLASGSIVTAAGAPLVLASALPNAFTDNSTGTASDTVAAGVGISIISIPITLAQITAAGDVLTTYTPGYRFKILSFDANVTEVVTTGGDAASLNLEIGAVNVTGGVIALTSANCTPLGVGIAGTAITAGNVGTAADTISIESSSVTAFAEGAVVALIRIQNMDTADAFASMADHINDIRTALV